MGRQLRTVFIVGIVVVSLLAGVGAVALGYIGQTNVKVILSGPSGTVKCNRTAKITARVLSIQNSAPIRNQVVRWRLSSSQSGGDRLSASQTSTNKSGRTSVTLSFGPVAGPRTVTATAVNASSSIRVRCAGGLPKTSPRLPAGDVEEPVAAPLRSIPNAIDALQSNPARTLRLDRLGIDLPILEGDGVSVPEGVVSHFPDTAWPGESSNTYLYAHAREHNFLELWQVRTGDRIDVDMADGSTLEYEVTEIDPVVPWDALGYLAPSTTERLTLQTSLSYADTAPRFIVIAEPVSGA